MRKTIIAFRDVMFVLSMQVAFRAVMMLRRFNY